MKINYTPFEPVSDQGLLITRELGKKAKLQICNALDKMQAHAVLVIDLSRIKFIDASCADEIVVRVMARLQAGEFPDKYIVYRNVSAQHVENMNFALKVAGKMVITYENRQWRILGSGNDSYRRALEKVVELKETTARQFQDAMGYRTVNEASTKLSALWERALVAREPFRQSVPGGGRQFKYVSLLKDIKDKE